MGTTYNPTQETWDRKSWATSNIEKILLTPRGYNKELAGFYLSQIPVNYQESISYYKNQIKVCFEGE